MRKPILTNKVLRGLKLPSTAYRVQLAKYEMAPEQQGDAKRACEWIAAMAQWWRETHEGKEL